MTRTLQPEKYPDLLHCGIGLTGLVKGQHGMDNQTAG